MKIEHVVWNPVPFDPEDRKALGTRLFRTTVIHHGGGSTEGYAHGRFSGSETPIFLVEDGLTGDRSVRGVGEMVDFTEYATWEGEEP